MSDTYPKQRAFPDNRDARSGNGSAAASDPLAELARLVGRDDPFKNLFTARDTQKPTRPERVGDGTAAPGQCGPRADLEHDEAAQRCELRGDRGDVDGT